MQAEYDLAIVGSGFGGSLLAMVARRIGLRVALLERGRHPRFAIGESTSPLMNLLIEQLAHHYDLPRLLPLTTYGAWQQAYPNITCGLKRGFTYYHHQAGQPFVSGVEHENQLLVAASPSNAVADTHWLRSDVDHFLLREALTLGVEYWDETRLCSVDIRADGIGLTGERHGQPVNIRAKFVVDASGPNGFLARSLKLPTSNFADYPHTHALYTHFTNVHRCDGANNFHSSETPPYAPDDAALHHVFDGGWMWVLRFNNGVTSAGVAVEDWLARELNLAEGAAAWPRVLARFPTVAAQFADATPVHPFVYTPRIALRMGVAAGKNWALLPSAAFVDPLFSTGMPLTLLGIERLARILEEAWGASDFATRLREYSAITLSEADWTAQFIAACYAGMADFAWFRAFSMFYFAAASHAEMARRIAMPDRPQRFLAGDYAPFARGMEQCAQLLHERAQGKSTLEFASFERQVADSIACLNVAGLCAASKRHWYGVDIQDVVTNAAKLGTTPEEMQSIIKTASWAQENGIAA